MKKLLSNLLITVTMIFIAFIAGVFLGRNYNHSDIQISKPYTEITETFSPPEETSPPTTLPQTPGIVNINTADVEELTTLPGIGEVLAQRIVEYRVANGPFPNVAALTNVEGIGTSKLTDMLDYVTTGG